MINTSPTIILFCATISLIAGIWIQSLCLYSVWITTALLVCVGAWWYKALRDAHYSIITIFCIITITSFALGSALYWHKTYVFNSFWTAIPSKKCSIRGVITDVDQTEHLHTKQRITMRITHIYEKKWHEYGGHMYLYTQSTPELRVADSIEIIQPIHLKQPTEQNFTRYLLREGVYATAFCNSLSYAILNRPYWSFTRYIAEWRLAIFMKLRAKMSKQSFSLLSALFLGNRSFNKKDTDPISLLFKRWGIAHVYARSGLHLALLVSVWIMLMRLIPLSYRIKMALLLSIGSLYALLSWSSISFTRALIIFLLGYFCKLSYTPYKTLHLLIVTCLCTLLYNPLHLFFLDFQLSFALTFALSLLQIMR